MNRHARFPSVIILGLLLILGATSSARAMAPNVDCRSPRVFPDAAVNVVILPYDYAGQQRELSTAAARLALMIELDTIFSIAKYGDVGAVHVVRRTAATCLPVTVLAQLTGKQPGAQPALKVGGGLVLVWGQIYEEGTDLYVQTYARFLRRGRAETLKVDLHDHPFTVSLPSQAFAFTPQHLATADLEQIERAFKERVLVFEAPNDQAKGAPPVMDLSTEERSFFIDQTQGEWMHILPQPGGPSGWVHAGGSSTSWPLRVKMPELEMVEAFAGYLRMRVAADAGAPRPEQTLTWVEAAVSRYAEADREATDPLPLAVAVGRAATGMLRIQRIKPGDANVRTVRQAWSDAAALVPYNPGARNLDVMGRLCTLFWAPGTSPADVAPPQRSFFRFAANNLVSALVLSPNEPLIANNLAQLYILLLEPNAPAEPAAVKPFTTEELKARLAALRTAVPSAVVASAPAPQ
jgi:hypothetical protein